jgi:predicted dehydrogenase
LKYDSAMGLTGIVIGAGSRGAQAYVPWLLEQPEAGRIVGVAEPQAERREAFGERFGVPHAARFDDWRALLAGPRAADFAVIATPDALHLEPALAALERGYAVLLEKPMAPRESDCERLVAAVEATGGLLQVCHVLRFAPLFEAVKAVIDAGELGDPVTIQHSENVSYWHYAHAYVRGRWRNAASSSPMILTKSCHDLDLLCWFAGAPPERLTSLARPVELREANAPEGAPERCIEGCAHAATCPYDAVATYRDLTPILLDAQRRVGVERTGEEPPRARPGTWTIWPIDTITNDPSAAGVEAALRTTRYGRCVYRIGDNDQPASQNVDVLFANGVNASFTLHSTSHREGRELRIDGTRGSLEAGFYTGEQFVEVSDHKTGRVRRLAIPHVPGAHGGGDLRLFQRFIAAVRGDAEPMTSARESLWSHRMAFAADRAARDASVVGFGG